MPASQTKSCLTFGCHIYRKRNFLYYRFRLPETIRKTAGVGELRVSLRTSYIRQAQKLAADIHALTQNWLKGWNMSAKKREEFSERPPLEALKLSIQRRLDDILSASNKVPISSESVEDRMKIFLENELKKDQFSDECIIVSQQNPDGTNMLVPYDDVFDAEADKITNDLNYADNYEFWRSQAIFEMISNNIITEDEVSADNELMLVRIYQKYQIIYNRIKAARLRGDYSYELPFLQSSVITNQCRQSDFQHTVKNSKSLLLGELFDKYCQTQIDDGN